MKPQERLKLKSGGARLLPWESARRTLRRELQHQPSASREAGKSRILLFDLDLDFERAHKQIICFDSDLKRFVLVAWVRGHAECRDIATILAMTSRQVRAHKQKVFQQLEIVI